MANRPNDESAVQYLSASTTLAAPSMHSTPPRVVVVGSLNLDYIATLRQLPVPGETVLARTLVRRFGGKGANQAVAAARHGARVSLVGCVGEDDAGRAYRRRLRDERIDTGGLSVTTRALTGTALIAVDDSAENLIVVAPGANGCLTAAAVRGQRCRIEAADILLIQFEVPMAALVEACRLAKQAGISVALNPSPLREGFPWRECGVDTLIVNEGEAAAIFGLPLKRFATQQAAWRAALAHKGVKRLFVTQGAGPTICLTRSHYLEVPALPVRAVDTVGAGDAFAGALVTRLAERADLATAVRYANCAGGLATLRSGAQEAIPSRTAVERHLRRSNS